MTLWQKLRGFCSALFYKERLDQQMDDEMRFHLEMLTKENIEAGMTPEQARQSAWRSFGGLEQVKEVCRDVRGVGWMETFWQDMRYGSRVLRKNPGFTGVVALYAWITPTSQSLRQPTSALRK